MRPHPHSNGPDAGHPHSLGPDDIGLTHIAGPDDTYQIPVDHGFGPMDDDGDVGDIAHLHHGGHSGSDLMTDVGNVSHPDDDVGAPTAYDNDVADLDT